MKKLINILLFLTICFGARISASEFTDIWNYGTHYMDIKMNNGKTVSFEDRNIIL